MNNTEQLCLLIEELKENKYPEDATTQLTMICHNLHNTENTEEIKDLIEQLQGINNILYANYRSDVLIDLQVYINTLRNEYDVVDPREIVHVDNGRGFVQ